MESLFEEVRGKFRAITHELIERKLTVTAMESCTGGQIASLLTDTEGSSEVFKGSLVTYSNEAKIRYGVPEDIFEEEAIRELYSIDNGFFDPLFGSIELPAPTGKGWTNDSEKAETEAASEEAEDADAEEIQPVFVISSGGTGIPVYRKLQKRNIPFIAGILYPNDIDYQLARLLATEVITTPAFEEIEGPAFARAEEMVRTCSRVIFAEFPIGTMNRRIRELVELAEKEGKLEIVRGL